MLQELMVVACIMGVSLPAEPNFQFNSTCPDLAGFTTSSPPAAQANGDLLQGTEAISKLPEVEILGAPFLEAIVLKKLSVPCRELLQRSIANNAASTPDPTSTDLRPDILERFEAV
jgi:hypothetical protein